MTVFTFHLFSWGIICIYSWFHFFKNFSGAVTFFDNESNGTLQTTIRYRRWSVLWFLYSRLNKPPVIDKIMTKGLIFWGMCLTMSKFVNFPEILASTGIANGLQSFRTSCLTTKFCPIFGLHVDSMYFCKHGAYNLHN